MRRVNPFAFYEMGFQLEELGKIPDNADARAILFVILDGARKLNLLLDRSIIDLGVSRNSAEELHSTIDQIQKKYFSDQETGKIRFPDNEEKIDTLDSFRIRNRYATFKQVFSAECQNAPMFMIDQKGIYATQDLIERADNSFPEVIRSRIDHSVRAELRAAGRCLALELGTASAFHSMRAIEKMIRIYLEKFGIRQNKDKHRSWAIYVKILENRRNIGPDPRPSDLVISSIMQIKDFHRNPILHDTDVIPEDANLLFDVAKGAIVAMWRDCEKLGEQEGPQLPL